MELIHNMESYSVKRAVSTGSLSNNIYLIQCKITDEIALIDCPTDVLSLIGTNVSIDKLIITHGHWDHTDGVAAFVTRFPMAEKYICEKDKPLGTSNWNFLTDNQIIKVGKVQIRAIHTPGHTKGSFCFYINNNVYNSEKEVIIFSGDTLFLGGPGATQSPQDFKEIYHSIVTKLLHLSNSKVLPGHGPSTSIEQTAKEIEIFNKSEFAKGTPYGHVSWLGN